MTDHNVPEQNSTAPTVRILLAEDDLTNQFVAKTMLEKRGFSVSCANNGLEACEMVAARTYDLVLMDVSMPEMDGIEATMQIRKTSLGKSQVPIIAMTAHNMNEVQERCLEAGMNDFVAKPVSGSALTDKINSWL